jgi:hypothetical protein
LAKKRAPKYKRISINYKKTEDICVETSKRLRAAYMWKSSPSKRVIFSTLYLRKN